MKKSRRSQAVISRLKTFSEAFPDLSVSAQVCSLSKVF
jgi:hypothetical protein